VNLIQFKNRITVFVLLFFVQANLAGQNGNYNIKHIQVKDGLPSSEVYQAAQDKNGFIWFGTDAGLAKYDGYAFTTYSQNDGLSNNSAIRLSVDAQNRLWALTMKSVSCIEKDTFVDLKNWNLPNAMVHYVSEDDQNVWFGAARGIYLLKNGSKGIEKYKNPMICDPVDPNSTYYIKGIDDNGNIWISEPNRYQEVGINLHSNTTIVRHYNNEVYKRMYYCLSHPDYVYTKEAILRFNSENKLEEVLKLDGPIKIEAISQLEEVNKNEIIVSTSSSGLYVLKKENGAFKIKINLLQNERISSFLRDREGNLWICTMGNGVFLLKESSLNIINYEYGKGISTLFIQREDLFLGYTDGNVELKKDLKTTKQLKIRQYLKGFEKVRSIVPFGNGDVLFGSDAGISLYRNGKIFSSKQIFAVKSIWADKNYNLYIAEANSTSYVPRSSFDTFMNEKTAKNWKIRSGRSYAAIQFLDKTYIGTTHGLYQSKGDEFEHLGAVNDIFNSSIAKLTIFKDSTLLLITDGAGIAFTNIEQTEVINQQMGLSSNFCNNVTTDDRTIWVATNKGITKISNYNFQKNNYNVQYIGYAEGLGSNEVNDVKISKGTVYVGTNKGLSVFKEKDLTQSLLKPEINITKFLVNGKQKDPNQTISLDHDQNNLLIEFIGIHFQSLGEISYQYRMKGLDNDWQTTKNNAINFHGLAAGDYQFEVKALNSNRIESSQAFVKFSIVAPFWKSIWFISLLFIGALLLAYIIIRLIVIEQQKNNLAKLVEDKTFELKEKIEELEFSNSKLVDSNEQLEKFAYIASHDLQEPLRTIGSFITLLKRKYKDRLDDTAMEYIDFAVSGTLRMKQLIRSLLQFSRLESNAVSLKQTNIDDLLKLVKNSLQGIITSKNATITSDLMPTIWVDPFQVTQLLQNLINNAIKFNTEDNPQVHITYQKSNTGHQFSVKDNGIGIEKEFQDRIFNLFQRLNPSQEFPGTGVGLAICKKVVTRHQGEIWVAPNHPTGTIFHFTIGTTEPSVEPERTVGITANA